MLEDKYDDNADNIDYKLEKKTIQIKKWLPFKNADLIIVMQLKCNNLKAFEESKLMPVAENCKEVLAPVSNTICSSGNDISNSCVESHE